MMATPRPATTSARPAPARARPAEREPGGAVHPVRRQFTLVEAGATGLGLPCGVSDTRVSPWQGNEELSVTRRAAVAARAAPLGWSPGRGLSSTTPQP